MKKEVIFQMPGREPVIILTDPEEMRKVRLSQPKISHHQFRRQVLAGVGLGDVSNVDPASLPSWYTTLPPLPPEESDTDKAAST